MNIILLIELSILLVISIITILLILRFIPSKLKVQESGQVKKFREILEREKSILEIMEELVMKKQPSSADEMQRFHEQWIILAKLLENQVRKEETIKLTVNTPEGPRVITDINPHIRMRAESVETIASVFKDSKLAPEMLTPFLSDPNNRVQANAAKAIYPYNPKMALDTLQQMSKNTDKWMRMSAAWALGEIATPDTGEMLQLLIDDPDEDVKIKARQSIQKILKKGKPAAEQK